MSISAGKLQQWVQVTHEMISDVGATEGQLENEENLYHGMNEASCPGNCHQKDTESMVHDRRIMQGFTDGHIAVVGHGTEDNHLHPSKEVLSKELGHAAFKEMVFLQRRESTIIFGTMTEEKHASRKDRKAKKKYMGEPQSAGLLLMVTTISKLPRRLQCK